MSIDARVDAWATLALKALPQRALFDLLRILGDPAAVLNASRGELQSIVPKAAVDRLLSPVPSERYNATRAWLEASDHELIAWDDTDYPRALLDIGDAPPVLFHVGRRDLLNRPSIAIVGSRNATPQGIENSRAFAAALADAGITIVSGLAAGIDAAAHEGALDHDGSTIAVVGTGLDRVYPARHRALAHAIALRGALLSEYPPGTPPLKENFPRRNRLLSGLVRGVLVVEATLSSGSLITARLAGEQGRDVFAIPGSIHSPFSKGPHKLIREGAKLVETAQDIIGEIAGAAAAPFAAVETSTNNVVREPKHAALLDAIAHDPVDIDTLMARTQMPASDVQAALTALELDGSVASLPGGRWQRVDRAPISRTRA
ncbi:MAG TPA: DNA-processing protein DprA [Casimicrobiaceae bacterium]|jgi:DNA processing protein